MSMTHWNHMSLMVPSPFGGCSTTMGPLRQIHDPEVVDGVGVGREEQRLGIHQFGINGTALSLAPMLSRPLRIAYADAPP